MRGDESEALGQDQGSLRHALGTSSVSAFGERIHVTVILSEGATEVSLKAAHCRVLPSMVRTT